jgi:hypothetical protein
VLMRRDDLIDAVRLAMADADTDDCDDLARIAIETIEKQNDIIPHVIKKVLHRLRAQQDRK